MSKKDIKVPNIGDFKDVEIIEILVKKDQRIKNIKPSDSFIREFNEYLNTLKNISY